MKEKFIWFFFFGAAEINGLKCTSNHPVTATFVEVAQTYKSVKFGTAFIFVFRRTLSSFKINHIHPKNADCLADNGFSIYFYEKKNQIPNSWFIARQREAFSHLFDDLLFNTTSGILINQTKLVFPSLAPSQQWKPPKQIKKKLNIYNVQTLQIWIYMNRMLALHLRTMSK